MILFSILTKIFRFFNLLMKNFKVKLYLFANNINIIKLSFILNHVYFRYIIKILNINTSIKIRRINNIFIIIIVLYKTLL